MTLTAENKAARRGLFTASEIHKLITPGGKLSANETREQYIMDVAFESVTGWRRSVSSKQMEHGTMYEYEAFESFSELFNGWMIRNNELFTQGNIGATPDGFVTDLNGTRLATIDIKCPWSGFLKQKAMALNNECPHEYYWQAQCQMYCTNVQSHYLVRYWTPGEIDDPFVLSKEQAIFWQRIERNNDHIELMIEAANKAAADRDQYVNLINVNLHPQNE